MVETKQQSGEFDMKNNFDLLETLETATINELRQIKEQLQSVYTWQRIKNGARWAGVIVALLVVLTLMR
jgi:hypothetical protein